MALQYPKPAPPPPDKHSDIITVTGVGIILNPKRKPTKGITPATETK